MKILVVDGDATVATFISRALRSKGWVVDSADNGPTAVELTLTGRYRLVILDLSLVHPDGLSLLGRILAARPEQKVIVLTGLASSETGVRALELGASDYIWKPFSVDELLARVGARLQEVPYAQSEHIVACRGLSLNMARRKVETGHGEVSLTEREFVLLACLMREQGRVFSRQELLSEVWGFSFDPGSNVVDVYVRRLRSKLGDHIIETVRSVGYALAA